MAEEKQKKPKINLKDRLGKSAAGAPQPAGVPGPGAEPARSSSPSIRPSVAPAGGGIAPPPGIAPPVGLGLAVNPFAPKPVAQPKAPPPSAEQQTIKIEVGEEIHAERKKAVRRSVIFGLLGIVLGLGLGSVIGGMRERKSRSDQAQQGAGALEGLVSEATARIGELEPMLDEIESGLKKKKYPAEVGAKLASFAVPFKASDLDGKHLGSMPPTVQTQLFTFVKKTEDLETKKDALKNVLGGLQKPMETAWAEEQKPIFKLGVAFRAGAENKMLAEMVQFKEPFSPADAAWPKEPTIIAQVFKEGRRVPEDKKAARWEKGDLTGQTPIVIPVEPSSVAGFTDERNDRQLRLAVLEIRQILKGDSTPGREATGLLEDGKKLAEALSSFHLRNK